MFLHKTAEILKTSVVWCEGELWGELSELAMVFVGVCVSWLCERIYRSGLKNKARDVINEKKWNLDVALKWKRHA